MTTFGQVDGRSGCSPCSAPALSCYFYTEKKVENIIGVLLLNKIIS